MCAQTFLQMCASLQRSRSLARHLGHGTRRGCASCGLGSCVYCFMKRIASVRQVKDFERKRVCPSTLVGPWCFTDVGGAARVQSLLLSVGQVTDFDKKLAFRSILVAPWCPTDKRKASWFIRPSASVRQVKDFKRKRSSLSTFVTPWCFTDELHWTHRGT